LFLRFPAPGRLAALPRETAMTKQEYQRRIDDVKARAHGHWPQFLLHLGLEERMITRRLNLPCPFCGGTDRFQFTDKFGEGNYHCRSCGPGGGFQLAQQVTGMGFHDVLQAAEKYFGACPPAQAGATEPSPDRMRQLVQRIWEEAQPIAAGDPVDRYLSSRGLVLDRYPAVLRLHPNLGYYRKDESGKSRKIAEYPAMLASIQGPQGNVVSLHRTYLSQGSKLQAGDAKKVLSSGIAGAAVRLFAPGDELALTEGIEKSIAVHLRTGKPAWAALSAGNLEKLWIPPAVTRVSIYADNDADGDFAGQAFAFALARRLARENNTGVRRQVQVFVPKWPGVDWSDIWLRRWQAAMPQAA
jgi:putative DNA primase/helicase